MWFKVDDGLSSSRKVLAIPRSERAAAMGLWVLAGAWSSGEALGGVIPAYMVEELTGSPESAEALVKVGLWERDGDVFRFASWTEYQPDAATAKAIHEAKSEGGARGNHNRWHAKRGLVVPGCPFCDGSDDRSVEGFASDSDPNPPVPSPSRTRPLNHVPESSHDSNAREATDMEKAMAGRAGITNLDRVVEHIERTVGRVVEPAFAVAVANWILGKARRYPDNPERYVLRAITTSAAEVQQHIDEQGWAA